MCAVNPSTADESSLGVTHSHHIGMCLLNKVAETKPSTQVRIQRATFGSDWYSVIFPGLLTSRHVRPEPGRRFCFYEELVESLHEPG